MQNHIDINFLFIIKSKKRRDIHFYRFQIISTFQSTLSSFLQKVFFDLFQLDFKFKQKQAKIL